MIESSGVTHGRSSFLKKLWGRRRTIIGLLAIFGTLPTLWVLSHAFPRSTIFSERRGAVASVRAENETGTAEGYITQAVSVTAATGLTVDLRVLRPAGPAQPLPLVVLLAGHRTGGQAVDLFGDPKGIVVAALDYPYHGPERPRGLRQSLRAIPQIQQGLLDTPPAVSVALDWLLTQPWVDHSQVELMGVSLGVPFAAVAGALDSRFRRVWLIHGALNNRDWLANRLESRISNPTARRAAATLLHLLAYGPSFRPEYWVPQIAPRQVMIVGADADEQMPRASVEGLHAVAQAPKGLAWSQGGHVSTKKPEIVRQLLAIVRTQILQPEGTSILDTN